MEIINPIFERLMQAIDLNKILALVIVLVAARVLQPLLRRVFAPIYQRINQTDRTRQIISVVGRLLFPLTILALLSFAISISEPVENGTDILQIVQRLVAVWLIFRLLTTLLKMNFKPEPAQFWISKVITPLAWLIGLLSAFGLLDVVLQWGFTIESLGWRVTIGSILVAAIIAAVFISLSRWVSTSLAHNVLPQAGIQPPVTYTIGRVAAYVVVAIGTLFAMSSLGIDLTTLTVVAGGLSVGLAFGLQEIFNNFISGFILIFERSLEPGHVVEVDGHTGRVQKISIRSTTIKTRDNVELIIPNSYFLTQVVTNLTRSEALIRTRVGVGVSYNSDPRQIETILLEVAHQHEHVLANPPPSVQFTNFGDSSLDFSLFIWTEQALQTPNLTSALRYEIWDALAKHNVEIPFPQRDIHIRSNESFAQLFTQ